MPFLSAFPVSDLPELPESQLVESRALAFRTLDGQYPFPSTGREFFFMPDSEGLDMPPRDVITKPVPGMDGERIKEIRTAKREIFLPLWMMSDSSHLRYLEQRDALASLFNYRRVDYRTQEGTHDLVAFSGRGERYLRCTYMDGMRNSRWPNEGAYWAKLGITETVVQPYWVGTPWATPVIRLSVGSPWFGPFPSMLATTTAIGNDIPVTVEGDADSWATIDLVGPASSVVIEAPGMYVSIPAGLGAGELAQIVTNPRGRTALFSGARDWARVAPSRKFRPLTPGPQTVNIRMPGATDESAARVSGPSLWERPW